MFDDVKKRKKYENVKNHKITFFFLGQIDHQNILYSFGKTRHSLQILC